MSVANEATGIVLTVRLPFVGVIRSSIDHDSKSIRITIEPDMEKLSKFVSELPKGLLELVSPKLYHKLLMITAARLTVQCKIGTERIKLQGISIVGIDTVTDVVLFRSAKHVRFGTDDCWQKARD